MPEIPVRLDRANVQMTCVFVSRVFAFRSVERYSRRASGRKRQGAVDDGFVPNLRVEVLSPSKAKGALGVKLMSCRSGP
jgi:hypothetical protein